MANYPAGGRYRTKRLQLPHNPPRYEKNADAERDGGQHREHHADHSAVPAVTIGALAAATNRFAD